MPIAPTPDPPYTAVVFTAQRTDGDHGYAHMADRMDALAARQPGYLGIESARDPDGHAVAQERGQHVWYAAYRVRIATVTRDYGHG